jgi:hypothetical protein
VGIQIVIVKLSRHVFGSHQGYRTLAASSDVTDEEITELESFAFGQTDDGGYLASLAELPAYWSRPLSSGRRAITRVLPGPTDDQGRQSLRFVTAILFANDWLSALNGEDAPLLRVDRIWSWNGQPQLPREEVRVSKPSRVRPNPAQRERVLSLLGLIETHSDSDTTTITVEEGSLGVDELAMVLALLPVWYRPRCTYAVRSLSESLPVQVNYLAPCASRGKSRRRIQRWTPARGLIGAKYASALAHFWTPGESPPWEFVENCKAFGRLLPTWEGTDSSAGTVALPRPVRTAQAERSHARMRVPAYVYWAFLVLLVIGATALVAERTFTARRHAEATLVAADMFLEQHPDPSELPASGNARQELIQQAEAHTDAVEGLRDASRQDRQATVAARLKGWLVSAGARAEEYGSLDELLAGFETFAEPLGLDAPAKLARIPDAPARSAVSGWKARLEQAQARADDVGGPYPARVQAALSSIARWDARVRDLLEHCQSTLAKLQVTFSAAVPRELNSKLLADWQAHNAALDEIADQLPPPAADDESADDRAASVDAVHAEILELREALQRVQHLARDWERAIDKLQADYTRYIERAEAHFNKHSLDVDPVRPTDLLDPWKAAQDAHALLTKALEIWSDAEAAVSRRNAIEAWMNKASVLAIVHFQDELDLAEETWAREKQHTADVNASGVADELPNPAPAKESLERALDYWRDHTSILRHFDAGLANQKHQRAMRLLGELLRAGEDYKARYQAAGPSAGSSGPVNP